MVPSFFFFCKKVGISSKSLSRWSINPNAFSSGYTYRLYSYLNFICTYHTSSERSFQNTDHVSLLLTILQCVEQSLSFSVTSLSPCASWPCLLPAIPALLFLPSALVTWLFLDLLGHSECFLPRGLCMCSPSACSPFLIPGSLLKYDLLHWAFLATCLKEATLLSDSMMALYLFPGQIFPTV